MASYAVTFTWEQDWGSDFYGEDVNTSCSWKQHDWYDRNVQCHAVQCLPMWDVDNVMQLWHLPATADPILVIGIYVSYVWKIALNRIDNIPWTIDCTTFTQIIWKSACDMNRNVKLMFDDRVAWQNFCQSSVDKQNVDKAWQRQKRASSLTSSSPINTRWSSTYLDELTTKRD